VAGALQHFTRPTQSPPDALVSEAQASTPDSTIDTFPPTIIEVYRAMNKIKAGKAPGVCGIYPEYIQHGGSDALCTLHKIVTRVWEEEVVPEEWHQGIIIPLYKGKGSKSECSKVQCWARCLHISSLQESNQHCCHTGVLSKADSRLATLCVIV